MSIYKGNTIIAGGGLPDQTGQTGKYLKTNGTNASWETLSVSGMVTSVNNIQPVNGNVTVPIPDDTSDLTNGAGYITSSALSGYATQTWVGQQGYITGITSSDVTTALGYTPYNSTNPNGYTSNIGTVTSINNTSPDGNGNVSLTIPTVNNATLTITQGGTTKGTFTANASSDVTIALDAGGGGSSGVSTDYIYGLQKFGTGTISYNNGICSFDNACYVGTSNFDPQSNPWEMSFTFSSSFTTDALKYVYGSNNGISICTYAYSDYNEKIIEVNIPSVTLGSKVLERYATPNTYYTVKITYDGTNYDIYLDGVSKFSETSSQTIPSRKFYIGGTYGSSLGGVFDEGTIDLSTSYIKIGNEYLLSSKNANSVQEIREMVDGQWVTSYFAIAINITQKASDGGVDYSLSSYLPNDNYKYEVLFSGFGEGSTTSSGLYLYLVTDTIGSIPAIISGSSYNGAQIIRAKGTAYGAGCVVLPVGSARKVTAYCSNVNNGAYYLLALGYRRIGTNQ